MAQRDEKAVIEVILKGQAANASLKDMEKSARALRAELSKMPADSDKFTSKAKEYNKMQDRIKGVKDELRGTGKAFFDLNKMVGSFVMANILTAGLSKITAAFSDSIRVQREFEKSLANLSAITGASGADLKFYGDEAIKMSTNVSGGATAVVEAFKLIGSAKPELLSNKEALKEVADAAILLSNAAGIELPDAATRLTDAMNQFGAPASEAAKYVDALAAAAKFGAAEVPQVTEALLQFGTAAKSSNIDIYESAAAIELLAEKGIKGAEAGTALRNVFAKMSAADVLPERASEMLAAAGVNIQILKDKTIPLAERLKELSKISGDAAAITKTFGLENKIAGEILISNLPRLAELNGQMKETGVATQQAETNLNTFDNAVIRAGNAWDNFTLSLTNGKTGTIFKTMIEGWTASLESLTNRLNGNYGKNQDMQSLTMIGMQGGINVSEADAKRLMDYGFKVDFVNGKIKANRMSVIALMKETDTYTNVLNSANATEEYRTRVLGALKDQSEKITVAYKNGSMSASDYATSQKIITDQMHKVMNASIAYKDKITNASKATVYASPGAAGKQTAAVAKHLEDLSKKIKEMETENSLHGLSEYEKNTKKIWAAHDEMLQKINENELMSEDERAHAIFVLRSNTNNLLLDEEDKHLDELERVKKEHLDAQRELLQTADQNELDALVAKFDKEIEYNKAHNISVVELLKEKDRRIQEFHASKKSSGGADANAGKNVFQQQYTNEDGSADHVKIINDTLNTYAAIESIGQAYREAQRNERLQEQREQDEMYNRNISREQRLLDQKVISKKEYDKRVSKLEQEKTNRQRAFNQEEYRRSQQAARYNTIMSGVEGIARIWAVHAPNPIAAGILTGILAAGTATRLALIASQKPPQFAEGGATAPGGMVNKTTLFSSASGRNFIAGEAGSEWVAPNWMLQNPVTANTIGMLEAVRQNRGFAKGGRTDGLDSDKYDGRGGKLAHVLNKGDDSWKVQVLTLEVLEYIRDNGIDARISYDELQRVNKNIESARNGSKIG